MRFPIMVPNSPWVLAAPPAAFPSNIALEQAAEEGPLLSA